MEGILQIRSEDTRMRCLICGRRGRGCECCRGEGGQAAGTMRREGGVFSGGVGSYAVW